MEVTRTVAQEPCEARFLEERRPNLTNAAICGEHERNHERA